MNIKKLRTFSNFRYSTLLVSLSGLAVTAVLYFFVAQLEFQAVQSRFNIASAKYIAAVEKGTLDSVESIRAVRLLFVDIADPTQKQFSAFVTPVLSRGGHLDSMFFIPLLGESDRSLMEQKLSLDGNQGGIKDFSPGGKLTPADKHDKYAVIRFVEPISRDPDLRGYNILSRPGFAALLEQATDSGEAVLTPAVELVQDIAQRNRRLALVAYLPLYREQWLPKTLLARRTNIFGYTAVSMHCDALFDKILEKVGYQRKDGIALQIFDGDRIDNSLLMYATGTASSTSALMSVVRQIHVGGRTWTVKASPTNDFAIIARLSSNTILLSGILLTFLLAFLFRSLNQYTETIEHQVQERTAELTVAQRILNEKNLEQKAMLESDLIGIVKVRNRITFWANTAYEKMLGYAAGELAGVASRQHYPNEDAYLAVGAAAYPVMNAGNVFRSQIEHVRKDGSPIWLDVSSTLLDRENNESLWVFVNVTERKLSEERLHAATLRLKESEHFIRAITNNIPGLVSYWDTALRCRFANNYHIQRFSKTPEEMMGMRIQDLLGVSRFTLNEPYLRRALQGEHQHFERTITLASGQIRNTWTNYIPDVDINNNVAGIFVLVSDVTELKQAEVAQRIAATAFESSEAMMITDANTVILRVNPAFTKATGYTSDDIVGHSLQTLQSDYQDVDFYAAMWAIIHRCGSWQGEIWNRRKSGEILLDWMTLTGVQGEDGAITHYVGTQSDITLRKEEERRIHELAFFDPLTGLPNRRMLLDRLVHGVAQAKRFERSLAVMFLDIDRFKQINDTFGHDVGDSLLKEVAKRLASCVRSVDTVSRPGGDEFIIVLPEISTPGDATLVAEKIVQTIREPFRLDTQVLDITTSIGIALYCADGSDDAQDLMKKADLAMYSVKNSGRNGYQLFVEAVQPAN